MYDGAINSEILQDVFKKSKYWTGSPSTVCGFCDSTGMVVTRAPFKISMMVTGYS